jgi:Sulfotransferase family
MWPVFVFGTGRCGSTHIQRLITLSTCCWIWGEHDGFLAPLLESVSRYEASQVLEQTVFHANPRSDDQLIADVALGSERLSWLNRLDRIEFRTEVASLVDRIFRSRLPQGWAQWGFKEILYGLDNDAPAALLRLFPTATAVFTFRDPKSTIKSMIRTWSPDIFGGSPSIHALCNTYMLRARRWKTLMSYFIKYREGEGKRIIFISDDKLKRPIEEILQTLELPATRAIRHGLEITNPGPKNWPVWATAKFDELFGGDEAECLDLFTRACVESDADFGV